MARPGVLFLTFDLVGAEMGGNAIRAFELARAVGRHAEVTLAAPRAAGDTPPGVRHVPIDPSRPDTLRPLIEAAESIVTTPQGAEASAWLRRSSATIIFDLYDPTALEALEIHAGEPAARRRFWATLAVDQLVEALHIGNRFICATERQRDLWIGAMLANRLLGPSTYDRDPSLRSVIDVVPFGVSESVPLEPRRRGPRARFPALPQDAEIVLWNGGIWNWLDPETVIRAVAELVERRPRVRLVFMGRAPEGAAASRAARAARDLAMRTGLLDRVVFFNDVWVPYRERAAWLLEADCAVAAQHDHLETRYAFRTRLLDCFWARLPVVCTAGDELAERIDRDDLGAVVAAGDPAALAEALDRVLTRGRPSYDGPLAAVAADLSWPVVAAPLTDFVTAPEPPPRLGAARDRRGARPGQALRSAAIRGGRRARRLLR